MLAETPEKEIHAETAHASLASLIARHAPEEGVVETKHPGLILGRFDRPVPRYPLVYSPSICVVAQGRKQVYAGDERVIYDPLHYLVVALPLPLEAEVVVPGADQPFLGLAMEINMATVGKLLLEMGDEEKPEVDDDREKTVCASKMSPEMLRAVERLVGALETLVTRRVIAPGAEWEMLYHVLKGEQGAFLRSMVVRDRGAHSITKVVRFLHDNYNEQHNIESIASHAGMSKSTLHHLFERFVGQSPIQYLKRIRLHQARLKIVTSGYSASEAAYEVGYKSASQFSREFKRQFGILPSRISDSLIPSLPQPSPR